MVAQQAVVDKDAGELVADGLVEQRRRHAGIHAAAQAEDDVLVADLLADFLDGLVDVIAHRPVLPQPQTPWTKLARSPCRAACGRLRGETAGRRISAARSSMAAKSELSVAATGTKPCGSLRELVAVGVPDLSDFGQLGEQRAGRVLHRERALAVLALLAVLDLAAEELRQQSARRSRCRESACRARKCRVRQRRVLRINTGRAAGEDDAAGLQRGDFGRRRVETQDDRNRRCTRARAAR